MWICSAVRTSDEAMLEVTDMIPVDILVKHAPFKYGGAQITHKYDKVRVVRAPEMQLRQVYKVMSTCIWSI